MKKTLFKGALLAFSVMFLATTEVSAQGFFKKLKEAAEKVESVTKTANALMGGTSTEGQTSDGQTSESDSISTQEFLANVPSYSVKKVIETDSLGNAITNEDGTTRYKYLLIDKNGNVCAVNTAKKHLNSALKSGAFILLKVGGSKKSAWIGAGIGAAAGMLASANDIKQVKEQVKLMKECKKVLSAYQTTFTEEGLPIDAAADLSNVEGINFAECEEITKSAADVKAQLLASKLEGDTLDDVEIPDDLNV